MSVHAMPQNRRNNVSRHEEIITKAFMFIGAAAVFINYAPQEWSEDERISGVKFTTLVFLPILVAAILLPLRGLERPARNWRTLSATGLAGAAIGFAGASALVGLLCLHEWYLHPENSSLEP
jgi:hypothetical protein